MKVLYPQSPHCGDVNAAMHQLLSWFADKRELLPRSISEVYENLQQLYVAEHRRQIIGTCALYVTWDNLAEVKALAVDEAFQGQGIGKKLMEAVTQVSKDLAYPPPLHAHDPHGLF